MQRPSVLDSAKEPFSSHKRFTSPTAPLPPQKTPAININLLPLLLPSPSTHCSSENSRSSSFLSAGHCFPARTPSPYSQVTVVPAAQTSGPHSSTKNKNSFNLFDIGWMMLAERITQISHQSHQSVAGRCYNPASASLTHFSSSRLYLRWEPAGGFSTYCVTKQAIFKCAHCQPPLILMTLRLLLLHHFKQVANINKIKIRKQAFYC